MKIGVIGVGTAGILSLSYFCSQLDDNWEVYSIHDPKIPIVGVGESVLPPVVHIFNQGLGYTFLEDSSDLDIKIKHGVRFVNWRKHSFFLPFTAGINSFQFNNFKLKDYAFPRLKERWGHKFKAIEGKVARLYNQKDRAVVVIANKSHKFDLIIDCRGFPKELDNYSISNYIPVNSALVYVKNKPGDWEFTDHVAHKNGWMFGIPLATRQSWGYLYDKNITSESDALADLGKLMKDKSIASSQVNHFTFNNLHIKKLIDGRIISNGNQAFFFEPLQAISTGMYVLINRLSLNYIKGGYSHQEQSNINRTFLDEVSQAEEIISFHYHGGSIYNSPFWQSAKAKSAERLSKSSKLISVKTALKGVSLAELQATNISFGTANAWSWAGFDPWTIKNMDKKFGYNYFK